VVNPKEDQVHMLFGVIYDTQKRYNKSEVHYRAALEFSPDFAASFHYLAIILANKTKTSMKHCACPPCQRKIAQQSLPYGHPRLGQLKK